MPWERNSSPSQSSRISVYFADLETSGVICSILCRRKQCDFLSWTNRTQAKPNKEISSFTTSLSSSHSQSDSTWFLNERIAGKKERGRTKQRAAVHSREMENVFLSILIAVCLAVGLSIVVLLPAYLGTVVPAFPAILPLTSCWILWPNVSNVVMPQLA